MRLVFAMVLAGLVALPLAATAQAGGEGATSEPNAVEAAPASEPPPEEPALQLKLDDAGVEVTPTPPRTFDGYTIEELELRKRRAAFGLIAPAAVTVAGVVLWALGSNGRCDPNQYFSWPDSCRRPRTAGMVLAISGGVGMIVGSIVVGVRTGELKSAASDYALEELELRVKRAKIGVGVSGGVFLVGSAMGIANLVGQAKYEPLVCIFCPPAPPPPQWVEPVGWTAVAFVTGGFVGMVTAGVMLGARKRQLRGLQRKLRYETPRRVQWDLAQSRLVF